MLLDSSHPVVAELRRLFPEGMSAGGSFSSWLPSPGSLPSTERFLCLAEAQKSATEQCLRTLLDSVGLDQNIVPSRMPDGQRGWPPGFVGSLAHKNTLVLSTIAKTTLLSNLGLDVERIEVCNDTLEHVVAPQEALPQGLSYREALTVVFSAKEAVFKAQFPTTGRRLSFADVFIRWRSAGTADIRGEALCGISPIFDVRCALSGEWVTSLALVRCV